MKSYLGPSYVQKEAIKLMNEYVNDRSSPMSVGKAAAEVKPGNNKIPRDVGVSTLREWSTHFLTWKELKCETVKRLGKYAPFIWRNSKL